MAAINQQYQDVLKLSLPANKVSDFYVSPALNVYLYESIWTGMEIAFDYTVEKKREYLTRLIGNVRALPLEETGGMSAFNVDAICRAVMNKFEATIAEENDAIERTLDSKRETNDSSAELLRSLGITESEIARGQAPSDARNNPMIQELMAAMRGALTDLQTEVVGLVREGVEAAFAPPTDDCHDPRNF